MAGVKPILFSIFAAVLVVIGVLDVVIERGPNKCLMTYMFEMPEYLRVPLSRSVSKRFPDYSLYVYGEGNYARILSNMKMTGIPVLFIPGNAGSYKQVRSLGSVAFRRAIDKTKRYHFNFFSVDLNEEFSGLYGALIMDQTEFVHAAIKKIFSLYKHAEVKPTTIILVGHSMGGMIARGLFTLPDFDANIVNTIFMQATPNQSPVLVLDSAMMQYYERVNDYWKARGNSTLRHVTLVSSGGGENDVQVRGGLTPLEGIVDENHGVSTSTIHTPEAWVTTDHRCIVWCKQVVFGFVRSMFDIVDEEKKKVTDDVDHRMSVFRHHFLKQPGSHGHVRKWQGEITLNKTPWTLMKDNMWTFEEQRVSEPQYLAMPILDDETVDQVVVVSDIPQNSWICVCELKRGEKQCSTCRDISSTGNAIPPENSGRKVVHIDLTSEDMARVTHVVIMVPSSSRSVNVIGEMYAQDKKHLSNSVPGLLEILMSFPESVFKGAMALDINPKSSFYRLKLFNLNNVLKVYTARLTTSRCTKKDAGEHAGSVLKLHVPWSNEDSYGYFKYGSSGNLTLKVQYVLPPPVLSPDMMDYELGVPGQNYDYVELYMYLDPSCHYKLRLTASFKEMLGQFMRFYGIVMPAFCVAALLITLVWQLKTLAKDGVCPSVLDSLWETKPYFVVPFVLIIQAVLQMKVVQKQLEGLHIPTPDIVTLDKQGISFKGMQLILYILALGLATFQAVVLTLIMRLKSIPYGIIYRFIPGFVTRLSSGLCILVSIGGGVVAATLCGAAGILVCYVLSCLQVFHLCYLARHTKHPHTVSRYNFFMLIFMILMWLLVLNAPPLIVWGKHIMATKTLEALPNDPCRISGTLTSVAFVCLLICDKPASGRFYFRSAARIIHVSVILMLVFGMVTLYRISYVIVLSLLLLAAVQVLLTLKNKATARPKTE